MLTELAFWAGTVRTTTFTDLDFSAVAKYFCINVIFFSNVFEVLTDLLIAI